MAKGTTDVEASTRARVLRAVLHCIADKGFYRASSNEIARTAGVSWGVIQHHFGSREALLVAAHRDGAARLERLVEQADVGGTTMHERLHAYWRLLDTYYGGPDYLAFLQISLNLTRDPAVSDQAAATITETNERTNKRFTDLERQVTGSARPELPDGFLFHALRGIALSHSVLDATTPEALRVARSGDRRERNAQLLLAALAGRYDTGSATAGSTTAATDRA